jgi:DNA repair protein RadC
MDANFNEKPREKLALLGPQKLDDHELLEIILGKGTRRESVFDIVKRLLHGFDQEELIHFKKLEDFQQNFQLGFVQACQLMAAFELGKRFFSKDLPPTTLRNADQVYERLKDMQFLQKEYARGLYVNTRYRLIHDEIITIGSLDANIIHPREIFRPAIEYGAYAIILVHNHPSGDSTPSRQDIEVTKTLLNIGNLLQIQLLDHLVIGKGGYTSVCSSFLETRSEGIKN